MPTDIILPKASDEMCDFSKPTNISDEMCDFLKVEKGSELARTSVTRMLNLYIKEQNLQDPSNMRNIIPDPQLKKLMNFEEGKTLSYSNIQTYINHHFIKEVSAGLPTMDTADLLPVV